MSASLAMAQVRPDAGTLSAPQITPSPLPLPSAPPIKLPDLTPDAPASSSVRITPAGFKFEGNTLFSSEKLAALLADKVNQNTNLAGLTQAASVIANFYREQGYLLTEAYVPEQAFQTTNGVVTIAIIEARIGRVSVQMAGEDQNRISRNFAEAIVTAHLKPGAPVTAYGLDKPILLLRDLRGYDAAARVEPGAQVGEADITVTVRAQGPRVDGSVSLDNYGTRAAGQVRAILNLNINNLLGQGDVLTLSGQQNDMSDSRLYGLGYTLPVGSAGTRIGISAARLEYALGKQFAALGATGHADVLTLNVSHPLIRSQTNNLYGFLSAEQKKLLDETATPAQSSDRKIKLIRLGLRGQYTDDLFGLSGFSAYGVSGVLGHLDLNQADLALDSGVGGLNTAGSFSKLNMDYQRTQFFSPVSSVYASFQAQAASKNLTSAERMSLGGPAGVRSYPVGEAIGDSGVLINLEYRHHLLQSAALVGAPVTLLAFYDYGYLRFNKGGSTVPGSANSTNLGAIGVGATAGQTGNFEVKLYLAWRTTDALPTTGDPDKSPRAWISVQKWL